MNEEILKQLTRIADALELAILPQNNTAYADKVKETLNVDDAVQELAPKEEVKTEKVEEVKELETQTYTHDDLKALCLSKSREDVANKPKLKALLKEFGAAKVLDVKSKEDLTTIITRINSGEF
tara:strand:- start:427 stop:798 length:372 start_codon:yes stop_codon:yes gene_type:complete